MIFSNFYNTEPLFPYAEGYYMVFPKGMEKNRAVGNGSIVIEEDYIIFFKADTPEDIKERFISDYAEYYNKRKNSGIYE